MGFYSAPQLQSLEPYPNLHFQSHHNTTLHLFQPCFANCSIKEKCTYVQNALGVGLTPHFVNGIDDKLAEKYFENGDVMLLKLIMLRNLLEKINSLPESDIVAIADTDIFWAGKNLPQKMIKLYREKFDGKIVFSSESNCYNGMKLDEEAAKTWLIQTFGYPIDYYPFDNVTKLLWYMHWLFCYHPLYPKSTSSHKFLNAGFLIASVSILQLLLPSYFAFGDAHSFCGEDDQCLWHAFVLQEPRVQIDLGVDFILSAHGHKPRDFSIRDDGVYFPEEDSYPFGIHANGISKQKHHMYEKLIEDHGHRFRMSGRNDDEFYFDGELQTFAGHCIDSEIIEEKT